MIYVREVLNLLMLCLWISQQTILAC